MSSLHATTIVARNYLPFARVLAATFRKHHPEGTFAVLLLDDVDGNVSDETAGLDLVRPEEFMDIRELHRMAMSYNVLEFSTALKPFLLRHLLDLGWPHAVYLDPDVRIFAPLDDLGALAEEHSLVLTPHTIVPMSRDDRKPSEFDILASGVYNLGFVAVGPSSGEFLDYWSERLRRDCISDPKEMMFTDQRWVDLVPGYFEHHILRDPTVNVAYWNVDQRDLRRVGDRFEVGGDPLRFFHFSGFDPTKPYLLSRFQGATPRILLSERPVLAGLCASYSEELFLAGWRQEIRRPYAYDSSRVGLPIDSRMRRLYRRALREAELGKSDEPPNPFESDSAATFAEWLRQPEKPNRRPGISRYLEMVHDDSDQQLHSRFPNLAGPDGDRFVEWVITTGQFEEKIPLALVPTELAKGSGTSPAVAGGVNLVGFFKAELGVGEVGRLMLKVLVAADVPTSTRTYTQTFSRQNHPFQADRKTKTYDVNILCANADRSAEIRKELGGENFTGYTIGVWAWETEEFPVRMHKAFDVVDEVWGISRFTAEAIRKHTSKPVYALPLPVVVDQGEERAVLERWGLEDRFVFLFMFDHFSVFERKNPLGLIEAFRGAFRPGDGPVLLIKTINGDKSIDAHEGLLAAAAEHPDVIVRDGYLTSDERTSLMRESSAYVSLHRSEGFGLTMAEAMALGKPVVATGYSGNLDFMTPTNSFLVGYERTPIPEGCEPYEAGGTWAEPDIGEASWAMRTLYENPEVARRRAERAQLDIRENHSPLARAPFVRKRLGEIRTLLDERNDVLLPDKPVDPLVVAARIAARPPETDGPSRLGGWGRAMRKAVVRAIRPYWVGQRKLDEALVEVAREERLRREAREASLEARISKVSDDAVPTSSQVKRLTEEMTETQSRLDQLAREIRELSRREGARLMAASRDVRTPQELRSRTLGGGLDEPKNDEVIIGGALLVRGWALTAPHPVARVEIKVDGQFVLNARLGLPRPDIDLLDTSREATICGFEGWIDLSSIGTRGTALTIEAVAHASDGTPFLLGERSVRLGDASIEAGHGGALVDASVRPAVRAAKDSVFVFTDDLDPGGAQEALLADISGLEIGRIATVLTVKDGPLRKSFEEIGIQVEVLPEPPWDDGRTHRRWLSQRLHEVGLASPGVVIVNAMGPFWGVEVADALGVPSVWMLHEHVAPAVFWGDRSRDEELRVEILDRVSVSLAKATEVVVPTPAIASLLKRHRTDKGFTLIAHAIDVRGHSERIAAIDPEEARAGARLEPGVPVVACIGPIEPSNGQVVIAQAMDSIARLHPQAQLVLIGSRRTDYERGLRRYIRRASLDSRISVLPLVDDATPWYAIADVLLCASDKDAQPRPILEAMACRVPVVAMDVDGVSDVVVDGHTGYLFEPSNVTSLAVSLDRALSASPEQQRALTERAFNHVARHHDLQSRREALAGLISRTVDLLPSQLKVVDDT